MILRIIEWELLNVFIEVSIDFCRTVGKPASLYQTSHPAWLPTLLLSEEEQGNEKKRRSSEEDTSRSVAR